MSKEIPNETAQIIRVTNIGMFSNLGLTGFKLLVGYSVASLGLIADGYHSLSDLATDIVVLAGAAIAGRPPDRNHPYGHGKFETFAAWILSAVLIAVGFWIVYKSAHSIIESRAQSKGLWIIGAAGVSLIVKEWLFRLTDRIAKRTRSSALKANAWHHRTDALSSIVVLLSGVAGMFGWFQADAVAGVIVGVMVVVVGGKIGYEALMELSEASAGSEIERLVEQTISECEEVRGWHRLRTRRIGRELSMDIHILLHPDMTVLEGHEIVRRIEQSVNNALDWEIHLTIHIDPNTEDIRTASSKRSDSVIR